MATWLILNGIRNSKVEIGCWMTACAAGTGGAPIVRSCVCLLAMLVCAAAPVAAGTMLYRGTFSTDAQVQEFSFTVASPTTVTLETYGYAGGTVNSTLISAGGFDPTIAVFLPPTDDAVLSSPCGGAAASDPVYHTCEDAYLQQTVAPGTYIVALMVNDNTPTGGPGDPFTNDGNPGFSCVDAGGLVGTFCDVGSGLGESRTGDWAFAITGADSTEELPGPGGVPEPGAASLMGIGMALVAFLVRRRGVLSRRIG